MHGKYLVEKVKNRQVSKTFNKPFDYWLKKNKYYHHRILKFFKFIIAPESRVLQISCKNGYILDHIKPSFGVGIDNDKETIECAKKRYKHLHFFCCSLNNLRITETFDYIILTSFTMETDDIQKLFEQLHRFCNSETRIIIETYSYLWEPALWIMQKLGLKRPTKLKNWISVYDLENFLHLANFEKITTGTRMLLPLYIPLISTFFNSFLAHLPLIRKLCLHDWIIARPIASNNIRNNYSVSVIIPCKNERGNIESAILRCPTMGIDTEIVFVEGGSNDGTLEQIKWVTKQYPEKNISFFAQSGTGKGNAMREGFAKAKGDIVMILDADLTTPPEELPKFFDALINNKGELINGSRLIYGMESNAMRHINIFVNFCFGIILSWLLGQKIKDTLCGTKVLFKKNYDKIEKNRAFFGNFDPFGDFDLLFGSAKINLKIIDMPVHYKKRTYGTTKIQFFKSGCILLHMCYIALKKFKLR